MLAGNEITVRVRLFGFSQRLAQARSWVLTLPPDSRVSYLLKRCREIEGLELPESPVVILNGRNVLHLAGEDTLLADGDEAALMQPVAGGSKDVFEEGGAAG